MEVFQITTVTAVMSSACIAERAAFYNHVRNVLNLFPVFWYCFRSIIFNIVSQAMPQVDPNGVGETWVPIYSLRPAQGREANCVMKQ